MGLWLRAMCDLEHNPVLTVDVGKNDRLPKYKDEEHGRQAEQSTMSKPSPILEPESLVTRLQLGTCQCVIVATFHCFFYGILFKFILPQSTRVVAILGRRHERKDQLVPDTTQTTML